MVNDFNGCIDLPDHLARLSAGWYRGVERFQKTSTLLAATVPDRMELGLGLTMSEQIISLHVELLPEGCYLATSEAIPGLVAQGRTVAETLEIARDVAKRLLEARAERGELTAMRSGIAKSTRGIPPFPIILGICRRGHSG